MTRESEEEAQKLADRMGWQYEFRLLPKDASDFETDILLWDDHVAFITFEEPYFGTVITSPTLAKTFRMIFKSLWETGGHPN